MDLEAPFALMRIRHEQAEPLNHGCMGLQLRQIVTGPIRLALVSNYMIDFGFLDTLCPALRNVDDLLIVHGMSEKAQAAMLILTPFDTFEQLVHSHTEAWPSKVSP
jgi:hypothetical protein